MTHNGGGQIFLGASPPLISALQGLERPYIDFRALSNGTGGSPLWSPAVAPPRRPRMQNQHQEHDQREEAV
jgi:hypothetical protein